MTRNDDGRDSEEERREKRVSEHGYKPDYRYYSGSRTNDRLDPRPSDRNGYSLASLRVGERQVQQDLVD